MGEGEKGRRERGREGERERGREGEREKGRECVKNYVSLLCAQCAYVVVSCQGVRSI